MGMRTIREAVAIFEDGERLESAVAELTSGGFDRADVSLIAPAALKQRPAASAEALAADPDTPHGAPLTEPDLRQSRTAATSMAAAIAGMAAAGFAVATGGVGAVVAGAAAAGAAGVGGTAMLVGRRLGRSETDYLDEQLRRGGALLWVRTPDPAGERKAAAILAKHASHVAVHEYPADPRDRHPQPLIGG